MVIYCHKCRSYGVYVTIFSEEITLRKKQVVQRTTACFSLDELQFPYRHLVNRLTLCKYVRLSCLQWHDITALASDILLMLSVGNFISKVWSTLLRIN